MLETHPTGGRLAVHLASILKQDAAPSRGTAPAQHTRIGRKRRQAGIRPESLGGRRAESAGEVLLARAWLARLRRHTYGHPDSRIAEPRA